MVTNNEARPTIQVSQKEIDLINFKNTLAILEKKSIASPQTGERMCKDCYEVKPLELFTKSISGRLNTCKKCTSNNKKLRNIMKRYGSI